MKKWKIALLLTAMTVFAAGCGNKNADNVEGTEAISGTEAGETASVESASRKFADLKGSDYVKLPDYSAIPITLTGDYTVQEGAEKEYLKELFTSYGPFYTEDKTKKTVGEGDIVNVDYVGKLDGTAFSGGTAENQNIDVYNNSAAGGGNGYIDGFTEKLKGASVGDVIDADVTFPGDYGNTELAGKAVVFTFTVNSIQKEMTVDDIDDAFAKEQFGVDTVEEMNRSILEYLESAAETRKKQDTATAIQDYLYENSEVEVPKEYLDARLSDYRRKVIETYCSNDEANLEEYASTYFGKTVEELEAYWKESMEQNIAMELIMDAVVEEMGITHDEADYEEYAQLMADNVAYGSVENMYMMYGYDDVVYGEQYLRDLYLYENALTKLMETAVVEYAPAAEATEAVEDTETAE
ncbi:MAG: trigger factor [Roseburia sp.]